MVNTLWMLISLPTSTRMPMKKSSICLILFACALTGTPVAAQSLPISFELRGSVGYRTGDFPFANQGNDVASGGLGFSGSAALDLRSGLGIYAGWGRSNFNSEAPVAGTDIRLEGSYVDEGFVGGASYSPPGIPLTGVKPWVRAGVTSRTLEVSDLQVKSDRAIGFEVGAGLDIPVRGILALSPAVTYQRHEAEFAEIEDPNGVSYVEISLGLRARP